MIPVFAAVAFIWKASLHLKKEERKILRGLTGCGGRGWGGDIAPVMHNIKAALSFTEQRAAARHYPGQCTGVRGQAEGCCPRAQRGKEEVSAKKRVSRPVSSPTPQPTTPWSVLPSWAPPGVSHDCDWLLTHSGDFLNYVNTLQLKNWEWMKIIWVDCVHKWLAFVVKGW